MARTGNLIFVLPLILSSFSKAEIALYYLFATVIALGNLADFGFKNTLVRLFAFTQAGVESLEFKKDQKNIQFEENRKPNWDLAEALFSMTRRIYFIISIILTLLLAILGTYLVEKAVTATENEYYSWLAWGVVVITTGVGLYGKLYLCYLEGFNHVALVKRVETLFILIAIITKVLVLVFAPSILWLIVVEKIWLLINLVRNYYLSRYVNDGMSRTFKRVKFDKTLFMQVWKPAWKTGVSSFMSLGLTNVTGIFYAQIGGTGAVASYLLALRVINQIRDVSMAPLYSKIPVLSRLRAKGSMNEFIRIAKRGSSLAHGVFGFGIITVGALFNVLIKLANSNVEFVSVDLWFLMGIAYVVHRYGAIHMQIYLTTNHVITHIVDSISGLIFILATYLLIGRYDVYAFPMAMIIGFISFYAWYAPYKSLKSMNVSIWNFDKVFLFVITIMIIIVLTLIQSFL